MPVTCVNSLVIGYHRAPGVMLIGPILALKGIELLLSIEPESNRWIGS